MWQPLTILTYIQNSDYTLGYRAATFFAGLAIYSHQVFVNVTQNNVGAGMDLAGVFPRYISMMRGSVIVCLLGIVAQPWRFLTQATVFLSVISSFGGQFRTYPIPIQTAADMSLIVFTSVTTVILVFDYWIIRKRKWVVPDLFIGGSGHIYWYFHGINPRAWLAYIVTVIPSLRKLPLL
jgi:nucleobase:cation symporter-1, NCS1 family